MDSLMELAARVEQATETAGKPIGRHMIEGQRMIAKVMGKSRDQDAQDIASVAECMAQCLENEMRLFEDLKTVALEAASVLRSVAMRNSPSPRPDER